MADSGYRAKVLNHFLISPPPGSVPTTHLPLSFLDILWILFPPMRRLFFYHFPHSTHHFMDAIFPTLKRSLSLTLQHFFPLAGNNILPPPQPHNHNHNHKPHILYTTRDSVPVTVAESIGCDFNQLIADYPRDAQHLYPFVPDLPKSRVLPDGTRVVPLLALQFTVFPNQGLAISIAFRHVVADGMAAHHFLKSWASICTSNGGSSGSFDGPLPCHDRAAVKHPNGLHLHLESIFLQHLSGWASSWNPDLDNPIIDFAPADKVRATFVLTKTQIQRLKTWVSAQPVNVKDLEPLRLSAFIVTCALVWSSLIQSTETEANDFPDEDELRYFIFGADCRNRLEDPIPPTYFGNCLDWCVVESKKKLLLERNNIVAVAKAIGNRVKEFEREPLKRADKWLSEWRRCTESRHLMCIAGSPKLRVYDTDFGWGRPLKSEVLHVDRSDSISLQESRDKEGGIEIGLGLSKAHMDRFIAIWEENLKVLCT